MSIALTFKMQYNSQAYFFSAGTIDVCVSKLCLTSSNGDSESVIPESTTIFRKCTVPNKC